MKYGYAVMWGVTAPSEPDYEVDSKWEDFEDLEWVAEDAAEDYHSNHDGWEAEWPITLALFDSEGKYLGTFSVGLEMEPSFSARKL